MEPSAFLHPFAKPAKAGGEFLSLVGGEGAELWDASGKRYIDGMASLWYCNAGHGQRRIIEAIKAQARVEQKRLDEQGLVHFGGRHGH